MAMPFEIPDPFANLRRQMRPPSPFQSMRGAAGGASDGSDYELSDQQREGVLKTLGRKALSGVGMVGNLLDLPGSMVRDVIGGQNPLDQLLSPFSSENRTSSRDLLERGGLLRKNKPGFDIGDVVGFAGDVLLDPLTYMTFGGSALSKAGRVAKASGLLDDAVKVAGTVGKREARVTTTLDDLLNPSRFADADAAKAASDAAGKAAQSIGSSVDSLRGDKLGGMIGIGLPFANPAITFGTGPTAQKLARGMDILGEAAKASAPIRAIRAGFDPRVMGAIDPLEQKLAELTHAKKPYGQFAAESQAWDVTKNVEGVYSELKPAMDRAYATSPLQGTDPQDVFQRMLRHTVETQGNVDEALQRFYGPNAATVGIQERNRIQQLASDMYQAKQKPFDQYMEKGGSGKYLPEDESFAHYPRYVEVKAKGGDKFRSKYVKTEGPATAHRRFETRQIPTDVVREMLTDPMMKGISGDELLKIRDAIDVLNDPQQSVAMNGILQQQARATLNRYGQAGENVGKYLRDNWDGKGGTIQQHADKLAEYIRSRWGDELYTRGPTEDMARYLNSVHRLGQSLEALHEFFAGDIAQAAGSTSSRVNVVDAFKELGLNDITATNYLSGILKRNAAGETVSREVVDAAKRLMQPTSTSKTAFGKAVTDFIDNGLRWFKNSVTLPFPSFWSRNFTSGQYMNLADGVISPGEFPKYGEMMKKAWNLWNKPDPNILRELHSLKLYGYHRGFDDVDYTMFGAMSELPEAPWNVGKTFQQAKQGVADNPVFLDAVPGWQKARVAVQTVGGTGAKANQLVEWMNRVPLYLYLTEKKGWDKFKAAMEVKKLHFDYGDMTQFERNYMKRVFPFYTFSRKVAPLLASQIAERPGGVIAQSIKTPARQRSDQQIVPDYVSETMAIPMGTLPEGSQRYITGFGLPWEDTLSFFGGGVRGGLLEAGSRAMPLIKGLLEWMTNQTFFQKGPGGGRPLEDLDPTLGRIAANINQAVTGQSTPKAKPLLGSQALEFAVANSPLTRFATTARQVTDQRKWNPMGLLNLLTGARVSDISPAAQDAILRERAQEAWKQLGARPFIRMSVPAEDRAAMSPSQGLASDQLKAILDEISKRTQERKKQRQSAAAGAR